jgi:hypothetical protein
MEVRGFFYAKKRISYHFNEIVAKIDIQNVFVGKLTTFVHFIESFSDGKPPK